MDTAITWCRDAGWDPALIEACHFYPSVGSVFYLSDEGGPTAVFNQSSSSIGLDPLVPNEIGLVHPKTNQQLLFKGNSYHGVMHPPHKTPLELDLELEGSDPDPNPDQPDSRSIRKTLLINYWGNDRKAGESATLTLPPELEMQFMDRLDGLLQEYYSSLEVDVDLDGSGNTDCNGVDSGCVSGTHHVDKIKTPSPPQSQVQPETQYVHNYNTKVLAQQAPIPVIEMHFNFLEDFRYWKQQYIPPLYLHNTTVLYKFVDNPLNTLLNNSQGLVHTNWVKWLPRNLTREWLDQQIVTNPTIYSDSSGDSVIIPKFAVDMFSYATVVTVNVPVTEQDVLVGRTPKHILADWRGGMPGGDPFPMYKS